MSAQTKRYLEVAVLILSLALAAAGVAKTYFVLPVKIEELERWKDDSEAIDRTDREMLIRIDERTKRTQSDVTEIKEQIRLTITVKNSEI